LTNLHINKNNKLITLDIKDLYTNLPKQGINWPAKHWLQQTNISQEESIQIILLINIIMEQNYFQYNNQFYKPQKGIIMGSPLSGTLAELYLQRIDKDFIKQWLDSQKIKYYRRYIDDIIIIYDKDKTKGEHILQNINNIDTNLTFKLTSEYNNSINFLDLTIHREQNMMELGIHRKETSTDTTIHNMSNHPTEQKNAAFRYYINRLLSLPLTQKEKEKEWINILNMAHSNGFSTEQITKLKTQITKKTKETTTTNKTKTWATFTYNGRYIRKITNIFKKTAIKIAYRTTNNTFKLLTSEKQTKANLSGVHKLTCNTCKGAYVGQTGRTINIRYKAHIRYIKTNNPQSAYALHILNNRHEYGPLDETMQMIKTCTKGRYMNCWETMYIQEYHQKDSLITEQEPMEHNILFDCIHDTARTYDNHGLTTSQPAQGRQRPDQPSTT